MDKWTPKVSEKRVRIEEEPVIENYPLGRKIVALHANGDGTETAIYGTVTEQYRPSTEWIKIDPEGLPTSVMIWFNDDWEFELLPDPMPNLDSHLFNVPDYEPSED